jgi:two-component system sensor histidine kinase CiaH
MFHSAALKLTIWYLAIIMAISLVFSLSLYRVSSDDLTRNVNRQIGYFNNLIGPDETQNYRALRSRQLDQDLTHLKTSLLLFNMLVLAGGGGASYWLARRTLEPIEASLESQSRFASDASHELRTPLTAIQTENEVALRNKNLTKSQAIGLLRSNLEEVAQLKTLSEGLLRLANGQGSIENPQPVSLKKITGEAVARYTKAAQTKKIKIIHIAANLKVSGDEDSLIELVSIFLDNSIKYSPKGSIIHLKAKPHHKNIRITVADSGIGISQADLPHIFERFYRTDTARTKNSQAGYGLGLAIAQRICEAHHGYIEVASTPGAGTVFSIVLPGA